MFNKRNLLILVGLVTVVASMVFYWFRIRPRPIASGIARTLIEKMASADDSRSVSKADTDDGSDKVRVRRRTYCNDKCTRDEEDEVCLDFECGLRDSENEQVVIDSKQDDLWCRCERWACRPWHALRVRVLTEDGKLVEKLVCEEDLSSGVDTDPDATDTSDTDGYVKNYTWCMIYLRNGYPVEKCISETDTSLSMAYLGGDRGEIDGPGEHVVTEDVSKSILDHLNYKIAYYRDRFNTDGKYEPVMVVLGSDGTILKEADKEALYEEVFALDNQPH